MPFPSQYIVFVNWLDGELHRRGWNDALLAERAGLPVSVLRQARSGQLPRWEACEALATALQLPPELVFRQAGLLAPASGDVGLEEWLYVLARLSPEDRADLLAQARLRLDKQTGGE